MGFGGSGFDGSAMQQDRAAERAMEASLAKAKESQANAEASAALAQAKAREQEVMAREKAQKEAIQASEAAAAVEVEATEVAGRPSIESITEDRPMTAGMSYMQIPENEEEGQPQRDIRGA